MTGKPVIRLLAREKDIKDKFAKGQEKSAGFDDVVQQIGVEYGDHAVDGELKDEEITEESGMAFIDGQLWTARSTAGHIAKGDPVAIVAFDGLIAMVEPAKEGHAAPST